MNKFLEYSKELRKKSQIPEQIMWSILRNRRFCNLKFRRQFCIGNYIVDFYCDAVRLVIEIDGEQHFFPENEEYDRKRTDYLSSCGVKVIRYVNSDIDHLFEAVCMEINAEVELRTKKSPT